ncbi:MAG: EamA family transporter [Rubrivivax sp.]|nr:EamA family transporter [Rubrivivax sp.]
MGTQGPAPRGVSAHASAALAVLPPGTVPRAAIAGLLFNAFAWGVSWWPFRELEARGLHALWATVIVYAVGVVALTLWRPAAWALLARSPALWALALASGATNATFNWGVAIGDVVRVVLLFYLMPLWAVLLARLLLGEALTPRALVRLALALAGAAIVLWPSSPAAGAHGDVGSAASWLPWPRALAEWLGVAGGFAFAMTNVLLRREAATSESARALAMFAGGVGVAGGLALALSGHGAVPWPAAAPSGWLPGVGLLALWFLAANLALQYGAARVRANVTAVVMVSEVLFASVSAVALGASEVTPALAVGAVLIVGAALLAAWDPDAARGPG